MSSQCSEDLRSQYALPIVVCCIAQDQIRSGHEGEDAEFEEFEEFEEFPEDMKTLVLLVL